MRFARSACARSVISVGARDSCAHERTLASPPDRRARASRARARFVAGVKRSRGVTDKHEAMIMRFSLVVVAVLTNTLALQMDPARLEGCSDPAVLAKALAGVAHEDWAHMTLDALRLRWPHQLRPVDCDADGCSSFDSIGRLLNGAYLCSEMFLFTKSEASPEGLHSVIVNYSTSERENTVAVARTLVAAMGAPSRDTNELGKDSDQEVRWPAPDERHFWGLFISFVRENRVWKVHLILSQYEK